MFLVSTCIVNRILSNETRLKQYLEFSKSYHRSYTEYRDPLVIGTKTDVSSRIKDNSSKKDTCFCGLLVELSECYLMRLVLKEYLEFSKSYHRSQPKYHVTSGRGTNIDVTSRIKDYCSRKDTCFSGLLVELNECYQMGLVLEEYLEFSKSYHRSQPKFCAPGGLIFDEKSIVSDEIF